MVWPVVTPDARKRNKTGKPLPPAQLGGHVAATATVLDLRSDLMGIPHVHFAIAVDRSAMGRPEVDTRVLALQSFLETYRERVV